MPKYSRELVAQVLAANDIVDIIGASLQLKAAGTNRLVGLCPFHQEKTPSFSVSRDRQMYYCFGCGRSGDALSFLQEHDGLPFVEALEKLAERAGIRLPAWTPSDDKDAWLRRQLLELNKFAARFYRDNLADPLKGGQGRAHLKARKLSDATVKRFGLGYAPDSFNALRDAARKEGYKDEALIAAGLCRESQKGSHYDFFRNRLMFPILSASASVVAFGGRDVSGESEAKYINTPENTVYKKSQVLYGLYQARDALRKEGRCLVVEGYFDLIRCFDAGVENVVAPCGTALTAEQAAALRRHVPEAVLVYDGDRAGVQAALRGVRTLTAAGLTVRALALPEGQDPDDFLAAEGREAFDALLREAPDFVTFTVRMNQERIGTIEGRTAVARELFDIFASMGDVLRRDEYLKHAAKLLDLNEWALRREFERANRRTGPPAAITVETPEQPLRVNADDRAFVAALLLREPLLEVCREALEGVRLPDAPLSEVLQALFAGGDPAAQLESDEARRLYAAAATESTDDFEDESAKVLVTKRINRFKKDALKQESERLREAIRQAEKANDFDQVLALMSEKKQIDHEIQRAGAA